MKCYWCGATEMKDLGKEMISKTFPERMREFCSWPCAVKFLHSNSEWRDDPDFIIYNVHEYEGMVCRNEVSAVYYR